ncbi:hypothetical protein PNOK_0066100 [Pyrrhoderma noxium]|uniref:Uncharacterized protein n=1 Tax=Pyrrhoderma noxium TaxID=2282107 RepID=A0A286UVF9_9AGAM|nr:hypothetical protein PNOK_0066100 [Pyrrhoderma noxium]
MKASGYLLKRSAEEFQELTGNFIRNSSSGFHSNSPHPRSPYPPDILSLARRHLLSHIPLARRRTSTT